MKAKAGIAVLLYFLVISSASLGWAKDDCPNKPIQRKAGYSGLGGGL